MAAQNELRPIIIKKKKIVGGDGHHGGAWKVAMMCPSSSNSAPEFRARFRPAFADQPKTSF